MIVRSRAFASARTAGDTPWAEKTTTLPGRNVLQLLHEHHALRLERADDVLVVDDGVSHVERSAVDLEREAHDLDRVGDPRAKPARRSENDSVHGFIVRSQVDDVAA